MYIIGHSPVIIAKSKYIIPLPALWPANLLGRHFCVHVCTSLYRLVVTPFLSLFFHVNLYQGWSINQLPLFLTMLIGKEKLNHQGLFPWLPISIKPTAVTTLKEDVLPKRHRNRMAARGKGKDD